ncbi:MAG TPA: hypothetical protein VGE07_16655 [Herpetosiphonaceae bacterium]
MTVTDVPPPNVPRVLLDGELAINKLRVPVLVSPGNHRLVVLQSQAMYEMQPGQHGVLTTTSRPAQEITIADMDRLALVLRYEVDTPAPAESAVREEFVLPSPED